MKTDTPVEQPTPLKIVSWVSMMKHAIRTNDKFILNDELEHVLRLANLCEEERQESNEEIAACRSESAGKIHELKNKLLDVSVAYSNK